MTDGQPGQNQAGAATEGNAQDTGFNVTFDEGNAGQQGTDSGNNANSEEANNGIGEGNDNTGAVDAFAWVPEDYREEFRNDSTLNQFSSQDAFIKAMLDDRKANGTAIKLPGENATDEEWGKFYDRLGRPASSNDYGLSKDIPEGLDFNEEFYNEFTREIYTAGLTKKQAEKIYNWYNNKS